MCVDALFRIAVVYALSDQLVQQFDVNPSMETAWILKIGLRLADEGGSDLCLTTGAPPSAKFDGELKPLSDERLCPGFTRDLAYELMDGQQAREFDEKLEMNLAISLPDVGRFLSLIHI